MQEKGGRTKQQGQAKNRALAHSQQKTNREPKAAGKKRRRKTENTQSQEQAENKRKQNSLKLHCCSTEYHPNNKHQTRKHKHKNEVTSQNKSRAPTTIHKKDMEKF
jgi:hypothetical protein